MLRATVISQPTNKDDEIPETSANVMFYYHFNRSQTGSHVTGNSSKVEQRAKQFDFQKRLRRRERGGAGEGGGDLRKLRGRATSKFTD